MDRYLLFEINRHTMKNLLKLLFGIVFVGIVFVGFYLYKLAMDSPHRISATEAKQRLAAHEVDVVLDVRTEAERNSLGFFPKSLHIPRDRLESEFPRAFPNKSTRVLVYCNTGQRARLATDALHNMGYTNTKYITGSHLSLLQ